MHEATWMWVTVALLAFGFGCGDDDDDSLATGGTGGTAGGAGSPAVGGAGGAGGDPSAGGEGGSAGAPDPSAVVCGDISYSDQQIVCTFDDGTATGILTVQTTPTGCMEVLGFPPVYALDTATLSIGSVEGAVYDWGGNHHNDSLEFDYGDLHYRYYHSSFGFGGRSCAPMDCVQVMQPDFTMVEDGCTADRTRPVVCVVVEPGAAVPDLTDSFAPCPGDPNYP